MRVDAETTLNVAIVDLDNGVSPGVNSHVLNAPLVVNADAIDTLNPVVDGFDGDIEINNNGPIIGDLGALTVNVPSGSWRFDSGTITANNSSRTLTATVLDGSDISVGASAEIVSNGNTESAARLDIQGTITVPDSDDSFTLSGGSPATPNQLQGGMIMGDGELVVSNSALSGNGTIDADIDGSFSSRLVADNGTLEVNGSIDDFLEIEATNDGVLDVALNWATGDAGDVVLTGGEVTGATIHSNFLLNPIRGHGLVTARVVNDGSIRAEGGTLVLDPSGTANDWDGAGNGRLHATSGDMILRNFLTFASFEGRIVVAAGHEVFVDGFRLSHSNDALLELNGGTYRTNDLTSLDASITTGGSGPSTIQNDSSSLLVFGNNSTITLNQNLHIDAFNAVIRSGATTSGVSAVVNDRHLTLSDGLGLPVALANNSLLDVGSEDVDSSLGTVDLDSLTQTAMGDLTIDILGLGSGQFDLLMVNNNAVLDGTLSVNLLGSFTPVLGNQWTILTTSLGLIDADDLMLDAPVVNDLTFDLIVNAQSLVLEVIEALDTDTEPDGDVDGTDFLFLQRNNPALIPQWELDYPGSPLTGSQAVPEPVASILYLSALLLFSCFRQTARAQ